MPEVDVPTLTGGKKRVINIHRNVPGVLWQNQPKL